MNISEALIHVALKKMAAPRKQKLISIPGSTMRVEQDNECILYLPNGHMVRVHTDASRVATHIEEDNAQHAIVRPKTIVRKMRNN